MTKNKFFDAQITNTYKTFYMLTNIQSAWMSCTSSTRDISDIAGQALTLRSRCT